MHSDCERDARDSLPIRRCHPGLMMLHTPLVARVHRAVRQSPASARSTGRDKGEEREEGDSVLAIQANGLPCDLG